MMPNIIFNIPLYFTTYIYTYRTLSQAPHSNGFRSYVGISLVKGRGFNSQPDALELHVSQHVPVGY